MSFIDDPENYSDMSFGDMLKATAVGLLGAAALIYFNHDNWERREHLRDLNGDGIEEYQSIDKKLNE